MPTLAASASAATAPGCATVSGLRKTSTSTSTSAAPRLFAAPKPTFRSDWMTSTPSRSKSIGPPLLTTTTGTSSASRQRPSASPLLYATTMAATDVTPKVSRPPVKKPLVGAAPCEHGGECLREDRDVEPDRPVLEVVEVEADEVVEGQLDAARHLPQACHAGEHEVALAMPDLELHVVAQRQRPRADERHLAAQDVQHLRQLVERIPADEPADARDPRVVLDLEQRSRGFVRALEPGLPCTGVDVHRAELEHPELALAEPDAPVAVEDGAGRIELDRKCDQRPEGRGGDDDQPAHDEVERPLRRPVESCEHGRTHREERHALTRDVV